MGSGAGRGEWTGRVGRAGATSTMASPGPNKYLRKEQSKEWKKGSGGGGRAERKMANLSPLSPGSTHLTGFRSAWEERYVDSEVCPIPERTFQQVELDQTFLGGNSVL